MPDSLRQGAEQVEKFGRGRAEIRKTAKISKELVLTGINLSAYGKDNGATLTALINEISDVDVRIRLGSLEAGVITDELLTALSKLKNSAHSFTSACNRETTRF